MLPVLTCSWNVLGSSNRDGNAVLLRSTPCSALTGQSSKGRLAVSAFFLKAQLGRPSAARRRNPLWVSVAGPVVRRPGVRLAEPVCCLSPDGGPRARSRTPSCPSRAVPQWLCPSMSWPPVSCRSLAQVTCLSSQPHVDQIGAIAVVDEQVGGSCSALGRGGGVVALGICRPIQPPVRGGVGRRPGFAPRTTHHTS